MALTNQKPPRTLVSDPHVSTMQEQPSHPPSDKLIQWEDDLEYGRKNADVTLISAWQDGFQAGADAELDACCEWLRSKDILEPAIDALRAAMRPKPPSLKEQALAVVSRPIGDGFVQMLDKVQADIVRRAIEALPD
jgi:hypothetical protein